MTNRLLYPFLFFLIFSCENKLKEIDKIDLAGKTFKSIPYDKDNSFYYVFQDSTYLLYQFKRNKGSYKLTKTQDTSYIFFDNFKCEISTSKDTIYDYLIVYNKNKDTLKIKESLVKWQIENLFGTWVEEKYLKNNTVDYPYYQIDSSKISFSNNISEYEINNTLEFINFNIRLNSKRTEIYWRIKELNKNEIIIDKGFKNTDDSAITHNNIKLIKKR